MSIIQEILNRIFWWRRFHNENKTNNIEMFFERWETCITRFQKIAVWEDPFLSLTTLGAVNVIFWTFVYLEWRFYGLVFFALLLAVLADWAMQQGFMGSCRGSVKSENLILNKESSKFRVLTVEELCATVRDIKTSFQNVCTRVRALREQQPATFCLLMCCCCLALNIVSRIASGVALSYALIMTVFTAPALCVRHPRYLGFLPGLSTILESNEDEDYFLEPSANAIQILSLADEPLQRELLVPIIDEANSLQEVAMPRQESMDNLDLNEEIPSPRQLDQDLSDESDLSESNDINFKARHFNEDGSSTSSVEELAQGLRFRGSVQRELSSDSSESFELISKDDL